MFYSTLSSKMGAYFNDVFELNTAKHKLLRFAISNLVADSTWSNRIVGSPGKGNKLNIQWL